jgi:hypothetical protein
MMGCCFDFGGHHCLSSSHTLTTTTHTSPHTQEAAPFPPHHHLPLCARSIIQDSFYHHHPLPLLEAQRIC